MAFKTPCVFAAIVFLFGFSGAFAKEIPPDCMVSFTVKKSFFETSNSTVSCSLLESRRVGIFNEIKNFRRSEIDVVEISSKLLAMEEMLKQRESDSNWAGWVESITGNALATIGLAACIETAGAGCALAVFGKILSVAGVINDATSESKNRSESVRVRSEIRSIRLSLEKVSPANNVHGRLVDEAISLCHLVQKECL